MILSISVNDKLRELSVGEFEGERVWEPREGGYGRV
jgi:hypothetical protein